MNKLKIFFRKIIKLRDRFRYLFMIKLISKINLLVKEKNCFNFWVFIVRHNILNLDTVIKNPLIKNKYSIHLNFIFYIIAKQKKEFIIPYSVTGLEKINPCESCIFISVHLPLNNLAGRAFEESGYTISSLIANYADMGNEMTIWGTKKTVPVILGDSQSFIKAKNALKIGNLFLYIDNGKRELNSNILFLSQKLNKKVYFFSTIMTEDFSIEIKFTPLPFPYNLDSSEIEKNIIFLNNEVKMIIKKA